MENQNINEEPGNVSPASRKRNRSQSSSSDDENSSDSEVSESSYKIRKNMAAKQHRTVSREHFNVLSQQVEFLTDFITKNSVISNYVENGYVDPARTTDDLELRRPSVTEASKCQLNLSELKTTVKDPIYAQANENYLKKLLNLQRFNRDDWYAIRFADVQKKYLATPGFVELSVNDSFKRYEAAMLREDPHSYLIERSFAALTNAILCQKVELHKTLQTLVDWAGENNQTLTPVSVFNKIESLFSKDSAHSKVSDDLLQLVCGRRADFINIRRNTLLRQIPEEYHRDVLFKIPPSAETLFNDESVQNYLQKIGGAEKLIALPRSVPKFQSKDNFYRNQKPSTSTHPDNMFFRRDTPSKRGKQALRPHRQAKRNESGKSIKQRGKKSRPSFKNKYQE